MYAVRAKESLTQASAQVPNQHWLTRPNSSQSPCSISNSANIGNDYALLLSALCACMQVKIIYIITSLLPKLFVGKELVEKIFYTQHPTFMICHIFSWDEGAI